MRKLALIAAVFVAISSSAFAQSDAETKKALDNFYAGMTNIGNALSDQRDTVCKKQGMLDQDLCNMQFAAAIALTSTIKFSQMQVQIAAASNNKDSFDKATKDLATKLGNLKVQLEQVSKWK